MIVNCDKCKEDFKLVTEITKMHDDIEKLHFFCSECGQEYVSLYTNKEIRFLQNKARVTKSNSKRRKISAEAKKKADKLRKEIEG